jgi:LysM repeat protein
MKQILDWFINRAKAHRRGGILLGLLLLLLAVSCNQPEDGTGTPPGTVRPTQTPEIGVTLATVARPTQALVQVTPTPSSTPPPPPAPTPVGDLIEEGDTLRARAIDNNTTVDAIETLNPGIQPNLLQIGQQVILPPPATPSFQSAAATQVPLQIEVINLNTYRTPSGSLWFVGEVLNNSHLPAENIQLEIGLSEISGQGIAAVSTWVTPGIVPSEGKAPFGALVPGITVDSSVSLAPPSAAVIGGQTLVDTGNRYLDLAVVAPEATIEESQVELEGRILNNGSETAGQILLVTTFYDAQGNVTGFHELTVESTLGPGEEQAFQFTAAPPGGQVVEYAFLVQGLVLE